MYVFVLLLGPLIVEDPIPSPIQPHRWIHWYCHCWQK